MYDLVVRHKNFKYKRMFSLLTLSINNKTFHNLYLGIENLRTIISVKRNHKFLSNEISRRLRALYN